MKLAKDENGQALVEFAVAFPVQLILTFGILQLAFLYSAHQVVHLASFKAARAALVYEDAGLAQQKADFAAAAICSGITGTSGYAGTADYDYPGWGKLNNSGVSREKTRVKILKGYYDIEDYVEVEVQHDYELAFPFVNYLFAAFLQPADQPFREDVRTGGAPHITIKHNCKLSKDFAKVN